MAQLPNSYELLSVAQAAKELGRHRWFVYNEIAKRRIPFHRLGGLLFIHKRDLRNYVARSRIAALGEKKEAAK